jgi:osomolarity two-component system, response regulator SSK1
MGDLKTRINNARKLLRRHTATSAATTSSRKTDQSTSDSRLSASLHDTSTLNSPASIKSKQSRAEDARRQAVLDPAKNEDLPLHSVSASEVNSSDHNIQSRSDSLNSRDIPPLQDSIHSEASKELPILTLQEASPDAVPSDQLSSVQPDESAAPQKSSKSTNARLPTVLERKQSLVTSSNAPVIKSLLGTETKRPTPGSLPQDYFSAGPSSFSAGMLHRKIWVKRVGGSATLVQIREDDLVDDVREMILRKYANSLGRSFDAPDLTLRIISREQSQKGAERVLGPEEDMCRTLDAYFPGGQTVDEALIIDVPVRKTTPRPSPRGPHQYYHDDSRPMENGGGYFPPMPMAASSPAALTNNSHESRQSHAAHERSISVLSTGHVPPLPSPGGSRRPHHSRPKYARQHTSSPTAVTATAPPAVTRPSRVRHDSSASDSIHQPTSAPPPPTPPAPDAIAIKPASTPPVPRVSSPRPGKSRKRTKIAKDLESPSLPAGILDGTVPPINVLIVEDNIINLRVLGAFMERLKVRWQRAMNGKEAVTKWRAGGFHLVLMDIQLPIMNGLEATKEIRRLERVNSIGVFSSSSNEAPEIGPESSKALQDEDKLEDRTLFKSPVIIVALTASSLQSDRHEALAAGCNDFLTKVGPNVLQL